MSIYLCYSEHVCVCVEEGGVSCHACFNPHTFSYIQEKQEMKQRTPVVRAVGGVFMNIVGYTKSTERKSFILIPLKHTLC